MSSIIDNSKENLLVDHVNKLLDNAEFSRMAVGYFFLSGFDSIKEKLDKVKNLKLLIGNRTNQATVEQLVKGHLHKEMIEVELRKQSRQTNAQKEEMLKTTSGLYSNDLELIEQNDINESGISALWELVKDKKIDVKVYTKGTLHSKAYLFDLPEKDYLEGIAIVGSSNLSISGMRNNSELNIKVTNPNDYKEIKKWFDVLWEESEDFNEMFMNVIKESWIQKKVTPYEIYIKTLYNLVKDRIEIKDHTKLTTFDESLLFPFQKDAYNRSLDILETNNQSGVFISDVVGLGKSYIAIALMSYYWSVKQKASLIICPASLVSMWEDYKDEYHIRCKILPYSELLYDNKPADYTLNDDPEYDGYGVVVIDESHNFRNSNSQRYKILAPYLQDKKVILLTATPQNNTVWDLYHQIKLFHQSDITDLNIVPNNLRTYFRNNEENPDKIAELLQNFLIRRTRNDIKSSPRYKELDIKFPHRKLNTLEYSIEETYEVAGKGSIYERIIDMLFSNDTPSRYNYSIYDLTSFLKKNRKKERVYVGLSYLGELVRGLLRVLLFKRLESSAEAFYNSIDRMIQRHDYILESMKQGYIITGKAEQLQLFLDADNPEEIEGKINKYNLEDFEEDKLKEAISNDRAILVEVKNLVSPILKSYEFDKKVVKLIDEVIEKYKDEKILIFSEFTDTVHYIHRVISKLYPNIKSARISAQAYNSVEKADIVRRFSPKSQTIKGMPYGKEEIQILVSTDVLSEGQNLQDCRIVVNYDFHWNPVRLIQRIGRVDRIGSEADEIEVFNFLPDRNIERNIGLLERVQNRINEIQKIFALDSKVLSEDEILNERSVFAIYSDRDENILDADDSILTIYDKAEKIMLELKNSNPLEYERIIKLKDGVRTAFKSDKKGTYAYLCSGNLNRLYFYNGKEIIQNISDILPLIEATTEDPKAIEFDTSKHNGELSKIYEWFKDELKRRQQEIISQQRSKEQQYFLIRLQDSITLFTDNQYLRKKVDELYNIFSKEIPDYAKRQLRVLRRENISNEQLVDVLQRVVETAKIYSFQEREIESEKMIIKTICSEGME